MSKLDFKLVRNRETFVNKKKNTGTASNYNSAINNFENFCMEKYAKADIIEDLKEHTDIEILDVIQGWIDYNDKLNPNTVLNMFSRIKKYLHHRGIKLHPQDIKEELEFRRMIEEELYPLTVENIQSITKEIRYKQKTLNSICSLLVSARCTLSLDPKIKSLSSRSLRIGRSNLEASFEKNVVLALLNFVINAGSLTIIFSLFRIRCLFLNWTISPIRIKLDD